MDQVESKKTNKPSSKKNSRRRGEAKIMYLDGTVERLLNGRVIQKDKWGIQVRRSDGVVSLNWTQIKRIEERGINCEECGDTAFWDNSDQKYLCQACRGIEGGSVVVVSEADDDATLCDGCGERAAWSDDEKSYYCYTCQKVVV